MSTKARAIQVGYGRRRPKGKTGTVSVVAPNHLQQQFNVEQPDKTWVTDITYIRTHEGWLFLAVVLDLFSRRDIGQVTCRRISVCLE